MSAGPVNTAISELYELGVALGTDTSGVFNPKGLLTRGQMAAFITRALAHTSVRPAGVSAQVVGPNLLVSVRDEEFQPQANAFVDVFRIDTAGADSAVASDGSCDEVTKVSDTGKELCKIDNSDPLTQGAGDATVALGAIDSGGTTVWAWTGAVGDEFGSDSAVYEIKVPEATRSQKANRSRVTTAFTGEKAKLGSSVVYTVQLEDKEGAVTGEKPAKFVVVQSVWSINYSNPNNLVNGSNLTVTRQDITTDSDGKATFTVSAPAGKADDPYDQFYVNIQISPDENAPNPVYVGEVEGIADTGGLVPVRSGFTSDGSNPGGLRFSNEPRTAGVGTISLKADKKFIVADDAGVSNRVTATVTDQYGEPYQGALVKFTSTIGGGDPKDLGGGRSYAVDRNGSYTLSYEQEVGPRRH